MIIRFGNGFPFGDVHFSSEGADGEAAPARPPRKPKKVISQTRLTVTNLLITLLFALVYYYLKLPAINLKNPGFYAFFLLLSAFYCVLSLVRKFGVGSMQSGSDFVQGVKDCCLVPAWVI